MSPIFSSVTPLRQGRPYHLYLPGDHPQTIFASPDQYERFLRIFSTLISPIADTFSYCLLPNHFHLFLRFHTIEEQIATWYASDNADHAFQPLEPDRQMAHLFSQYAAQIKAAHPLFASPVQRVEVRDEANFNPLVRYIHQNPTLHQSCNNFRTWRWSSYKTILSRQPTQLAAGTVLRWFYGEEWFDEMHWLPIDEASIGYLILRD